MVLTWSVSEENRAVTQTAHATISELYKLWINLENECHQLEIFIEAARNGGARL